MMKYFSAGLAAALLTAAPAFAQDATPPADTSAPQDPAASAGLDSITIGLGAGIVPDYEGSDDYRFAPVPGLIGSYHGFSFQVTGNRLSVDLIPNTPGPTWDFQAGPVAAVNFNRADADAIENPQVKLLAERDIAIEVGGYIGIGKSGVITSPYDKLSVSLSYRYDVAGVHESGILQPSINYLTPLSRKAAVGIFVSAERVENGYADAYFSITPAESAASGLPVYDAEDGWKSYSIGALGTYSLTGDLLGGVKLVASGIYKRLLNDFADSPVTAVGSPNQWVGTIGIGYTF